MKQKLRLIEGKVTENHLETLFSRAITRGVRREGLMHLTTSLTRKFCKFKEMTEGVRPAVEPLRRKIHFYAAATLISLKPRIETILYCPVTGEPFVEDHPLLRATRR